MKLENFIPVIECSLKCADKRVVCVDLAPTDTNELRIYMDDYFIRVDKQTIFQNGLKMLFAS